MKFLSTYLLTTVVFFAIDMVWLGLIAKNLYAKHLGHLMADKVVWPAAISFYLLYIVGILLFAVRPAVEKGEWTQALFLGAALGLLCYATYDLTNLATLKNWPLTITLVDLAWGATLTGLVSVAGYFIAKQVDRKSVV